MHYQLEDYLKINDLQYLFTNICQVLEQIFILICIKCSQQMLFYHASSIDKGMYTSMYMYENVYDLGRSPDQSIFLNR